MYRVLAQLSQGEDLIQTVLAICQERQIRCGTIQVTGVLDELAVTHYDRSSRAMGLPRQFRGAMQILYSTGTLTEERGKLNVQLSIIASRLRDNGVELLGGICTSAKIVTAEVIIDAMEDLIIRRDLDRSTGLHLWNEVLSPHINPVTTKTVRPAPAPTSPVSNNHSVKAPSESPISPSMEKEQPTFHSMTGTEQVMIETKTNWADAVMASVKAAAALPDKPEEEEEGEEELFRTIQPGDVLDHQQFGRCVVQRVDADQEFVTVRLRNSRLVRLNLEVLNLRFQGEEEGHQVFATAAVTTGSG